MGSPLPRPANSEPEPGSIRSLRGPQIFRKVFGTTPDWRSAASGTVERLFALQALHLSCTLKARVFAFSLPSHTLPRYPAGMPVLIGTRQALVKCKVCGAQTPSLTRGVPVLPSRVPCSVCGARQVYRPSEVFIGSLPQVWKGQALR